MLERVEITRIRHGYGLTELGGPGVVKIALEDCDYLGERGWLIVEGRRILPAYIVDCPNGDHKPLSELGLLGDVNIVELNHKQALFIVWERRPISGSIPAQRGRGDRGGEYP